MTRCSVVIAAYNVERYVGEAIASALAQTEPDVEVIVVDDGSTDATAAVIDSFGERVIHLSQPNGGVSSAFNRGIAEARGDHIALLGADDTWRPHRLRAMLAYLDDHPEIGFATSDAHLRFADSPSAHTYYGRFPRCRFRPVDQAFWITQYNFVFSMAVIRRELFERHGGLDESLVSSEDWDLWVRFITSGERVGLVLEPLGHYRIRRGSLSADRARMFADAVIVLERAMGRPEGRLVPGLTGTLALVKGGHALMERRWGDALHLVLAGLTDRGVSRGRRLHAVVAGVAPRVVWRLQMARRASAQPAR